VDNGRIPETGISNSYQSPKKLVKTNGRHDSQ
jgi:hypothetical protein